VNQRKFLFTVIGMSLALIGLIFLQAYWLRHDLQIKEQQFGENVMMAMNSIVEKVEEKENQRIIIRHFINSEDTLFAANLNTDSLMEMIASVPPPPPEPPMNVPSPGEASRIQDAVKANIARIRKPRKIRRDEADLPLSVDSGVDIRIERDIQQKEVFAVQMAAEAALYDSIARETEKKVASRMRRLSTMMQKFTLQISDRSNNVFNRVDTVMLDSIVQHELRNRNIDLPYSYGISKSNVTGLLYVEGKDTSALKNSSYRISLFPGDIFNRNEQFMISFSGKLNYLLLAMWPLLLSSIVFTLAICLGFAYTLSVIFRQKKLADIKNDFINNMTHEFKTPIATIAIANESIRDPRVNENPDKLEYYTTVIRDENQRMLKQVENVLQMAQIDKGELTLRKTETDLSDVLLRAVQSSELTVQQRDGILELEIKDQPLIVYADGNHLLNVITNLIDNANKYSPGNPHVKVTAEIQHDQAVIRVSDKGIGMSREVQKKIFDTFFRASGGNIHDVKGFGLGLSYVKAIITAHEGFVSVESEPGKGSTFTITLPLMH
jgi:two-component system phosphate regulon sensor histidine kinase PhoR